VYISFKNFHESKYKEDVSMTPFHVSYIFDDPDDVVWCHNKLLNDVVDSHAPLKERICNCPVSLSHTDLMNLLGIPTIFDVFIIFSLFT
jgi:hypothetical protein